MVRRNTRIASVLGRLFLPAVPAFATALLLVAGCGGGSPRARAVAPPPMESASAPSDAFANPEARDTACLVLRDHVIVLFADDWADREGVAVTTPEEKWALYTGLAQQLEQKGTLARFAASCVSSLTPRKFECGIKAATTRGLVHCMRLGTDVSGPRASNP
jgi:hypothetical protein